jgi:ribosomal protein S27AE
MRGELDFNKIMRKPPRCPLCHRLMTLEYDPLRKLRVFACRHDEIAINIMDPLVGRWEEKRVDEVKCPMPSCETNMRLFFTSVGFLMAKCPKCGAIMKGSNPDRLTMPEAPGLMGDGVKTEKEEPK